MFGFVVAGLLAYLRFNVLKIVHVNMSIVFYGFSMFHVACCVVLLLLQFSLVCLFVFLFVCLFLVEYIHTGVVSP